MSANTTTGGPGDFDFIIGDWQVNHRRLKSILSECDQWVEFSGLSSTVYTLGGFGNVEDNFLDFPDGAFRAKAIRSFDPQSQTWSIWWLDGRLPHALDTPVIGEFSNGIGVFYADEKINGQDIKVRFIWNSQQPEAPTWEQAFSSDDGKTWETNWTMQFTRK